MGKQSRRREAGATAARALISDTAASAALETCKGHGLKNSKITDGDLQQFASIKDMFRGEEQKHLEGIDDSDAKTHTDADADADVDAYADPDADANNELISTI